MKTRLITENYIKSNSPITDNVQMKDIYPHIDTAQDSFLRVILGSSFLDYLKEKYKAQSLSQEEIELMENYIQPALLWRTLVLAFPFLHLNLRNKGFIMNNDDNGQPINLESLKFLINEAKNRAEVLESLLAKYLCSEGSKFPQFKNQDGITQPDVSTSFDSGLIFY